MMSKNKTNRVFPELAHAPGKTHTKKETQFSETPTMREASGIFSAAPGGNKYQVSSICYGDYHDF
jgi:hypothetical protein